MTMQVSQSSTSNQVMMGLYDSIIIYTSFCLLIASSLDPGMMGGLLKLFWLFSLAAVAIFNLGAAVGLYIVSVAIYSVRHYKGWGSILERPDNFALAIILIVCALAHLRKDFFSRLGYLGLAIAALVIYALVQMVGLDLVTRDNFALFMRMLGIPLVLFVMMAGAALSHKDVSEFSKIMMVLGIYMALISAFERIEWYAILIPTWIADPALNVTIGTGRSGGLLLQSEWNGFALGLIFCITLGRLYIDKISNKPLIFMAAIFSLLAIFFTYTRAAWLALLLAILFIAARSAPSLSSRIVRRFAVVTGILCFLGFLILAVFPLKMAQTRVIDENTITYRLKLWTAGLRMVAQKPLLGHGFGQFKEQALSFEETGKEVAPDDDQYKPVAHNTLISIIAELGLFGLMLYLGIFFFIYFRARNSCSLIWGPASTVWVTALMLVYLINSQFVVAHESANNLIYYSMMGILVGLQTGTIE
jgi:hypothetical protein